MPNFIDTKIEEAKEICKKLGCDTFDDALKKLGVGKNGRKSAYAISRQES